MFISFPVVGLGFGMMSGVFSLVNVLADSVGPGTVGFNEELTTSDEYLDLCRLLVLN